MKLKRLELLSPLALCCAALLVSCDDEPTQPALSDLEEVPLSASQPGEFWDIAFAGTVGIAVGGTVSGVAPNQTFAPLLVSMEPNGSWAPDSTLSLPASGLLTAAMLTPSGEPIIAGVDFSPETGFILDGRSAGGRVDVAVGGIAFSSSGDTLRLAGASATTEQVLISTTPGSWIPETTPYPTTHGERALQDLSARSGDWVTCGFDDAGDGTPQYPNQVLFLNQGSGWERISISCGGCSAWEFKTVAMSETGGILLGGAFTNFGGGANEYTASLLVRSVSGDWADIVLPSPTQLKRVNDILIAQDGTVYLACGMETSYLMRSSPGQALVKDATLPSARIHRLTESPDGTIWAVGAVLDSQGAVLRPAIWKRLS